MKVAANPAIWLAGYIPDIPTPFDDNGALDLAAFAGLCERQIRAATTKHGRCSNIDRAHDTEPVA